MYTRKCVLYWVQLNIKFLIRETGNFGDQTAFIGISETMFMVNVRFSQRWQPIRWARQCRVVSVNMV